MKTRVVSLCIVSKTDQLNSNRKPTTTMRIPLTGAAAFKRYLLMGTFAFSLHNQLSAQSNMALPASKLDSAKASVTNGIILRGAAEDLRKTANGVPMRYVQTHPYVSLQQLLKGNAPGTYVQEPTGEPGTEQPFFVQGISSPLLGKRELFDQQPTVFLNGIPLTRDNPFAYEIQRYDFNRIGPATNLLSIINPNNIESIEVIRDPVALAALGPMAAQGAIWITTKNAQSGFREISINSYYGYMLTQPVSPVNAAFESQFRQPFYDRFGTINDRLNVAPYLRDSTNSDYYGAANWTDLYYKNTPVYSADLSLTGGSSRANFRFFASATKNAGNADDTKLNRYNGSFFINVAPLKWLSVSSMIAYTRLDRTRNRNVRDRLAEQRYIPDLTNPLTPNNNLYRRYLNEFDNSIDDNINNVMQGYVAVAAKHKNLYYNGRIGFDYSESIRDVFYPSTLLEGNNFVSNYFGYNQRLTVQNAVGYEKKFGQDQTFKLEFGQNINFDLYKYDYALAYNGPNDFIKINVVNGDPNAEEYLRPNGFRVFYFPSRMQNNLLSFYGNAHYKLGDKLTVTGLVRRDGSSNMQPDNRWFTGFALGAEYNLKSLLESSPKWLSSLSANASFSRLGRMFNDDRFNAGAQYRVDMGWNNEPTLGSYAGLPGLSRPYTAGWVGYGIPWSYADRTSVGIRSAFFDSRLQVALDVYNREDKNMLLPVPVASEFGYTGAYKTGLHVNNRGFDFVADYQILPVTKSGLGWNFSANLSYNRNKLQALPDGLTELVLGTNKLVVGKRIDSYWLHRNNGVYNTNADVPVNPANGERLSYQGVPLQAGDPRWADLNGDYVINDNDKELVGNYMPRYFGGFGSTLQYRSFQLNFQFAAVMGRKVLNQYAASRLDFINTEARNDINSVKEITFWEKKQDLSSYPLYNPWSTVVPYRVDQDLFLDNASFLRLRSVTLNYDLSGKLNALRSGKKAIRTASIYVTGTNLFTLTPFKGDDPELVNYNGVYGGMGMPIPRSVIIGFRIDL